MSNLQATEGNPPPYEDNNNSRSFTVHLDLTINSEPSFQSASHTSVSQPSRQILLSTLDAPALNQIYHDKYGINLNEGFLLYDTSKPFPVEKLDASGVSLVKLAEICSNLRHFPQQPLLDHCIHNDVFCRIGEGIGLLDKGGTDPSDAGRQFRHIHNWLKDANSNKINVGEAAQVLRKLGYNPIIIGSQWQGKLDAKTTQREGIRVDNCAQQ